MERLVIAPLTRSGFTSFVALQLFEVVVTADFLNNPQRNSGVAHLTQGGAAEAVGGGSLDAGSLERFSQNLVRARRGANASNGGSGDGRGINKSGRRGNALMLGDGANLQSPESSWFEVFL
jgi:hypothetical protein